MPPHCSWKQGAADQGDRNHADEEEKRDLEKHALKPEPCPVDTIFDLGQGCADHARAEPLQQAFALAKGLEANLVAV
jgi:hypothetical protein